MSAEKDLDMNDSDRADQPDPGPRLRCPRRWRAWFALRHACRAGLLRRSKNLRVVQEQLRHVDIQTTTGYTRLTQQDVRQALETLDGEGE